MKFLNPKAWFEGVILRRVAAKGAKYAASALVGLLAGEKAAGIFKDLGLTLDPQQLELGLAALIAGGIGAAMNWAKVRFSKKAA